MTRIAVNSMRRRIKFGATSVCVELTIAGLSVSSLRGVCYSGQRKVYLGNRTTRHLNMKMPVSNKVYQPATADATVAAAVSKLGEIVAAVKKPDDKNSEFSQALDLLRTVSRQESMPIAIIGGMAAIRHGYERLTNDLDIVVGRRHLDTIIRIAPTYGIKVVWKDPKGWHKLQYGKVRIEVVPEGGTPSPRAPTTVPSPRQLGVSRGLGYASLEGWVETKLSSARRQDEADVVQILKKSNQTAIESIREHLATVHPTYVKQYEELVQAADEEKQQELERGGMR